MRLHLQFAASLLLGAVLLFTHERSAAQRRAKQTTNAASAAPAATTKPRPESVVMLPEGARPQVDTALLNPGPEPKRRRRFEVKVVPAAPPGRSQQEIMYTDSIANRSPRR